MGVLIQASLPDPLRFNDLSGYPPFKPGYAEVGA